jgi:hypothetical protein
MVFGGFATNAIGAAGLPFSWSFGVILAAALARVGYSFFAYRALHPALSPPRAPG